MRDRFDSATDVAIGVVVILTMVAVGVGILYGVESLRCNDVGARSGRKSSYGFISGCFVEVNGRMIPLDSWRGEETR